MFKENDIEVSEKARLIIKFGIGAQRWTAPQSEIEKKFLAEVIILQLE